MCEFSQADINRLLECIFNDLMAFIKANASLIELEYEPVSLDDSACTKKFAWSTWADSSVLFSNDCNWTMDLYILLMPPCRKRRLLTKFFLANASNFLLMSSSSLTIKRRHSSCVTSSLLKRSAILLRALFAKNSNVSFKTLLTISVTLKLTRRSPILKFYNILTRAHFNIITLN